MGSTQVASGKMLQPPAASLNVAWISDWKACRFASETSTNQKMHPNANEVSLSVLIRESFYLNGVLARLAAEP